VRPEPVKFLDGGVFPLGKLINIAGLGGSGKGMFWVALAADLTRGRAALGLSYEPPAAIEVLLIGCEDGYKDTVVPRLLAAGADLERVHILDGVRDAKGTIRPFSLTYIPELEAYLTAHAAIALVIIDPITGYIGRAGVKDHHDAEVRSLLEPLAELANRLVVTVLVTKHLNKDEAKTLASRVGGSIAYVNVPRACFVVADDPQDAARRILAPFKWNLNAPRPPSIAWTMEPLPPDESEEILGRPTCDRLSEADKAALGGQLNRLVWEGAVEVGADDLLTTAARVGRKSGRVEIERATAWLAERLADGPAGSVLCALEGDREIGRDWPPADMPAEKRRPIVFGRVKWWREAILKGKLGGSTQKWGFDPAVWFFRLDGQPWPPSDTAIESARRAEGAEESERATVGSQDPSSDRTRRRSPVPAADSSASSAPSDGVVMSGPLEESEEDRPPTLEEAAPADCGWHDGPVPGDPDWSNWEVFEP
jgi:hypothetical protein